MIQNTKQLQGNNLKVSPTRPIAEQLEKINQFTRRKFEADEIYIGQLRLAHNAIDRDGERFSEEVLERFKATIVRRTMLFDHARHDAKNSAIGKFFDVEIEKMPVLEARKILGEDILLPQGVSEVQILAPWFYIPINGIDKQTITKIDAGIYDYASIGFRAEALVPITDSNGNVMYHEFRGRGKSTEATEGSLVYLGAQPGMGVKSSGGTDVSGTGDNSNLIPIPFTHKGGNSEMGSDYDDLLTSDYRASDDHSEELCLRADCEICNQKAGKKPHKMKTLQEVEEDLLIPDDFQ